MTDLSRDPHALHALKDGPGLSSEAPSTGYSERPFGLADRIRPYRPAPCAQAAVQRPMADLTGKRLPDPMLPAHAREDETALARESRHPRPRALALARVQTALRPCCFTEPRS
ncbi:class II D-tagatose-bisphosphate aldolase non-catalytic subunit [Tabrizicola sp.]|uniref:class II D-tagatose-bisphosphate aldolase non-catalytic subunit n=1 Tax=Tabrizicola sp. TaxID=2005166 RepID=UPI002FDCFFBE